MSGILLDSRLIGLRNEIAADTTFAWASQISPLELLHLT